MVIGNNIVIRLGSDNRIALGQEPVTAVRIRRLGGEETLTLQRSEGEEVSDLIARAVDEMDFKIARQAARVADAQRLSRARAEQHS